MMFCLMTSRSRCYRSSICLRSWPVPTDFGALRSSIASNEGYLSGKIPYHLARFDIDILGSEEREACSNPKFLRAI